MFYTLLCLKEECYGMDILDRVPAMTNKRVNVGSGTLYTLLEQFMEAEMIRETKIEGRRRSYILTDKGREMLEKECARLAAQQTPEGSTAVWNRKLCTSQFLIIQKLPSLIRSRPKNRKSN